jgi:DNA-binding NtrC family response regulator
MKKKVLVIDDESEIVVFMEKFLAQFDISAIKILPGEGVVDCYNRSQPDFVFLDVQMPNKDGMAILKELKKNQPASRVIMMTGVEGKEFKEKAKRYGALDYITKPIDLNDLSKKIEEYIIK